LFALLLVLAPALAVAQEARCTALGANCLCSEPLEMTGFTSPTAGYWNPNDSTTKQCSQLISLDAGAAISSEPTAPAPRIARPADDPTMFAALPAGNTVPRILKPSTNTGFGGFDIMHWPTSGIQGMARIAARWYLYYSPTYQFGSTAPCDNSGKRTAPREGFMEGSFSDVTNRMLFYGWGGADAAHTWGGGAAATSINMTPGQDTANSPTISTVQGKWWRIEFVVINNTGSPGAVLLEYWKNVTNNLPEFVMTDTRVACVRPPGTGPGCGNIAAEDWTASVAANLTTPSGGLNRFGPEGFRNGSGCTGYPAYSHYLMAAWSTNAGQRIGAATEVEGGGGPLTPPGTPGSLTVTMALLTFSVVAVMARLASGRRRR
jgi:hypothetical protein